MTLATTFVIGISEQTLYSCRYICFARFPYFHCFPCLHCFSIVWKRGRREDLNIEGKEGSAMMLFCKWDPTFDWVKAIITTQHTVWTQGLLLNGWLLLGRLSLFLALFTAWFSLSLRALFFKSWGDMGKERRPGAEKGTIAGRNIRLRTCFQYGSFFALLEYWTADQFTRDNPSTHIPCVHVVLYLIEMQDQ